MAEDEPITQEISHDLLKEIGFTVDVADDGQKAFDYCKKTKYDLILMDMKMPVLNGLDATRAIRTDPMNLKTPILAMTANAFDEDRQLCIEAGMNDHIAKPVDPAILYRSLLLWLPKIDLDQK